MIVNTFEVAELGNEFSSGTHHHDLITLIRCYPEIVVVINGDAIRAVDAVDEYARLARISVAHRNLHDRVIPGIGNEHDVACMIELNSVGSEWRNARGRKQGIADPYRACAAI